MSSRDRCAECRPDRADPGTRLSLASRTVLAVVVALCLMLALAPATAVRAQESGQKVEFCCERPRPWVAATELVVFELIPWSVNRFVRKAEFARITPSSIWSNIRTGFEWDPNTFSTNQFAHPFHGNLFFSTARSNGFNYWESGLWAFGGSLIWEMAGERFRGAINDWVSTSMGGMAIGESTFRLASAIRDNEATGGSRVARELGAMVLNPVSAISRAVHGDLGKVGPNPTGSRPQSFGVTVDAGQRRVGEGNLGSGGFNTGTLRFRILYGDPFDAEFEKPFDVFTAELGLNFRDKTAIGALEFDGILWRTEPSGDESSSRRTLVLDQRFDYQNNQAFEYGGQSFGLGLVSTYGLGGGFRIRSRAGVSALLLGAIDSEYAPLVGRDYDFVTGGGLRAETVLSHEHLIASVKYDGAFLHTINGSPSDHLTHIVTARAQVPLWRGVGFGILGSYFIRSSRYDEFPTITRKIPEIHLFAAYSPRNLW